jgi:hypothetical protein
MTTAIITRIYLVNLDSPLYPDDMPAQQRLTEWLEEARKDPEIAFKCLVQDDVVGQLLDEQMASPTINEEITDLRRSINLVQANIAAGRYDKAEQEEMLRRHRARLNELMMLKTSPDEMEKAFGHVVAIVILLIVLAAAIAGGFAGYKIGMRDRDVIEYRDKVNFCHDRMKSDTVQAEWRQMYCGRK